jgi:hypothetical protein
MFHTDGEVSQAAGVLVVTCSNCGYAEEVLPLDAPYDEADPKAGSH